MPDFYSKRHRHFNRTYKGVLSKEELDAYIASHHEIMMVDVLVNSNLTISYFTDDYVSGIVFGISNEKFVPMEIPFPRFVALRDGVEDGIVDTIDKQLIVMNSLSWHQYIVVWSVEELYDQLIKNKVI
jgi:hypothetical protein